MRASAAGAVGWLASEVREVQPLDTLSAASERMVGSAWLHWARHAAVESYSAVHSGSAEALAQVQSDCTARLCKDYWLVGL